MRWGRARIGWGENIYEGFSTKRGCTKVHSLALQGCAKHISSDMRFGGIPKCPACVEAQARSWDGSLESWFQYPKGKGTGESPSNTLPKRRAICSDRAVEGSWHLESPPASPTRTPTRGLGASDLAASLSHHASVEAGSLIYGAHILCTTSYSTQG